MKKVFYTIILIIIAGLTYASFHAKPFLLNTAKKQLQALFPDSTVRIAGCSIKPFKEVKFYDISIGGGGSYDIEIKMAGLRYDISSLLVRRQARFYISGALIKIQQLRIDGAAASGTIDDKQKTISVDSINAGLLAGFIKGGLVLKYADTKMVEYIARVEAMGLDMEQLIDVFKVREKFLMNGKLNGRLTIKGKGDNIYLLGGDFSTLPPGGTLTINDTAFLETMAAKSGKSLDLLVETFKEYRYNNGIIRIQLESKDLVMDMSLNGEAGKRDLKIVLHDFKIGRYLP